MKNEFDEKLGLVLKSIRESKSMSQQDVADRLKTTRVCIGHYERGNRSVSMETLMKLCSIYGIKDVNEITNQVRKYVSK